MLLSTFCVWILQWMIKYTDYHRISRRNNAYSGGGTFLISPLVSAPTLPSSSSLWLCWPSTSRGNCQSTTAVPALLYCRSEKSVASTATSGPSSPSSPVTSSPGGTTPGRWRQKSSFSLLVTSGPAMQPSLSRSSSVHSLWLRAGQHEDADQGHQALGTSPSTACSSVHTATAAC